MSDSADQSHSQSSIHENHLSKWSAFWFAPESGKTTALIRRAICLTVAVYFLAAWPDVSTWLASGAPASSSHLASFFKAAELDSDAFWMLSPLFLWDRVFSGTALAESALVYRIYLLGGISLALLTAASGTRFLPKKIAHFFSGQWPTVVLWIWFVGWANRCGLLAGIFEPVASVSLAAIAIAPPAETIHWRHTFSRRLIAIQATVIAIASAATMLASNIWWNGMAAYAIAAPVEDRPFDFTGTFFETAFVYESLTAILMVSLPVGCYLSWHASSRTWGRILIGIWCVITATLGAQLLYTTTFFVITMAMGPALTKKAEQRVG